MQSKRPITPDDVVLAPTLSDPQVSPDGSNVAFVLGEASRVGQHEKTAIWLMPVAGDEPARPFTSGDAHDFGPRWSPEGRFLAFISDRHERGKPQPYLIAVQGGEAERLPELKGEVKSLYWSPDGAMLAAIVVDAEPEERDRQVKDLDDAMVFGADWRFAHLWTIRLADRQVNQVTSGESHAVSPAWSPDSSRIALITVDSPWADATYSPALIDC
ncbi:MAG: peptidase prolyl oligopeptidase active site domain protein [Chloroflexi bacterium]|nr:peptidase prolyl oligopeptidase active site domain protein [Chloroflexota bacterium]